MTKILSAVAPIAGAGAGFLLGGPSGAALGLGLGGAAGGVVSALNPPNTGGNASGINAAAYQPVTPEGLDPYLARLYPPAVPVAPASASAPPGSYDPAVNNLGGLGISDAQWANYGTPAGNAPYTYGPPGTYQGTTLQQDQAFVASLAAKGVDTSAPDFYLNPEWQAYSNANFEATAPMREAMQKQYAEQGYVGPPGLRDQPVENRGLGGAPSISVPQINGGTPAYNIAGGSLSKTNTIVQNEFARRFPEQLAALDQLRAQVAPNVSLARQAALGQVRDSERQAQGNLRQQMARRGVLGSSFGQSAESQMGAEFAKQAAQVEVQAAQQEMDLTTKFIDMQRTYMAEALTRDLTELGFGTELAIASGRMATDIANIQANLAAAELQAKTQMNVANIGASASRYASDAGVTSAGISARAGMTNAELAARSGIIQAGMGANSSALGYQTQASIAQNQLASQESAGRANLFGNLAGLGLGAYFNSQNSGFGNQGVSTSGFNLGSSNPLPNFNFGRLGFG